MVFFIDDTNHHTHCWPKLSIYFKKQSVANPSEKKMFDNVPEKLPDN